MRDIGPYARVGRVADHENCTWASTIFEHSGSVQVKKKATLTISEGSMILRCHARATFDRPKMPSRFEIDSLQQG